MEIIQFTQRTPEGKEIPVKVIPIPLETLEKTQTLLEYDGRLPVTQPVKHYDFIRNIQDIVSKDYMIHQEPIYVTNAAAKRIPILDPDKIGVPQSWLFQRLVTRINVQGDAFSDGETNMNIAIGFNDRGIQVAYGQNVRVCQNQVIFGARFLSTYGPNKMPYEKMLEVIMKYTQNIPKIRESDLALLSEFKATPVRANQVKELIGDVHLKAVKQAYFNDLRHVSPMNISQVSSFSRNLGQRIPELYNIEPQTITSNLYDIYNDGTQIFKPEHSEITTLWEDVNNWGEYINDYKLILS